MISEVNGYCYKRPPVNKIELFSRPIAQPLQYSHWFITIYIPNIVFNYLTFYKIIYGCAIGLENDSIECISRVLANQYYWKIYYIALYTIHGVKDSISIQLWTAHNYWSANTLEIESFECISTVLADQWFCGNIKYIYHTIHGVKYLIKNC